MTQKYLKFWHEHLGYSGHDMMRRIINNAIGHNMQSKNLTMSQAQN